MRGSKKIYIVLLILSLACKYTYSSYSYFTSQSVDVNNNISIGELEPEEGLQELVEANINGNILESITLGLNTLSSAGSLALGILFVSTLTRLIMSAKKKREFRELEKRAQNKK